MIINELIYHHTSRVFIFLFFSENIFVHIICKKYIITNCFFLDFNYKKEQTSPYKNRFIPPPTLRDGHQNHFNTNKLNLQQSSYLHIGNSISAQFLNFKTFLIYLKYQFQKRINFKYDFVLK